MPKPIFLNILKSEQAACGNFIFVHLQSGVAQNKGYNKKGHIFYVFFFVVTLILCALPLRDERLE